jgi:hypothetical protein
LKDVVKGGHMASKETRHVDANHSSDSGRRRFADGAPVSGHTMISANGFLLSKADRLFPAALMSAVTIALCVFALP